MPTPWYGRPRFISTAHNSIRPVGGSVEQPTPTPASGDLNAHGSVNALDLQLEVNVILGTETNTTIRARADINGDGSANALDLQRLVNLVLGL
jgi:hypothetical protein